MFIPCIIYFVDVINFIIIISVNIGTTQWSFWYAFVFVITCIVTVVPTFKVLVRLILVQPFTCIFTH